MTECEITLDKLLIDSITKWRKKIILKIIKNYLCEFLSLGI